MADRFGAYFSHHRTTAIESLVRLLATPVQSLLTWLVVAIALALPTVLYLGLVNIERLGDGWQGSPKLSVFLHQRASDEAIQKVSDYLLTKPEVAVVDYISATQALDEFQAYSGFGEVLETLDSNPLPGVLVVQPEAAVTAAQLQALSEELRAHAVVDDLRLDLDWVRRLQQIMALGQRLVLALGGLLALGVLLAIGNTIRLAIENRRDEIVVVKLVGGTNAFVRRPFLYTGWWYGVGGGLLAWVVLGLGLWGLSGPVAQLAELYQSDFRLQGLGWPASVYLVAGSGLLGWCGAWVAVGRHLGAIEPT
nr:permease-like cell division protein FtsX [Exilibacterium tricleocarpae]